jgi:hypothetical protein
MKQAVFKEENGMNRNRYLLCLLICGLMLYFAVPRLSLGTNGAEEAFSIVWLMFALIVMAGNLTGLLYQPKKHLQQQGRPSKQPLRKKKRYDH